MSILVTGGTGMIGSNVIRTLVEQGRSAVAYDIEPPSRTKSVLTEVKDSVKIEIGDIKDLVHILDVIKKNDVEGIIHLGAIIGNLAADHPIEALEVNIMGSANVLEAARRTGVGRVILASSVIVLPDIETSTAPVKEEAVAPPWKGIYALSKITCEQLVYTYRQVYGVDAIAIRLASIYGPGGGEQRRERPIDNLVMSAVEGKPIHYETGGDFASDLTYIKDATRGIVLAYDCSAPTYHVYNIGSGQNRKTSDVCQILRNIYPRLHIEIGPGPWSGDPVKGETPNIAYRPVQKALMDISRARRDFGFIPEWNLERAIPDWVNWLGKQITSGK
jgi:nucleoside-diphosphate-sugar epimerase